jgi:hypothetical protein
MSIFHTHTLANELKILGRQQVEAYRYLSALIRGHGSMMAKDTEDKLDAMGADAKAVYHIHEAMVAFCNAVAPHLKLPTVVGTLPAIPSPDQPSEPALTSPAGIDAPTGS